MGQFLQAVQQVGSVDEARIPLASLFLWVQVLHAFDVPRRRDLAFSMVSGLILMAEAGALSLTTGYALYLVPWLVLAGMWLYLSSRPRPDQVATPVAQRLITPGGGPGRGRLAPARAAFMPAAAALLAGALVFLALPRVPGSLVKTPPFAFPRSPTELPNFDGGVTNPNLPAAGADGVVNFAPGAYPGLSDVVDLRARGRLSDRIAFRVRASQAALWRAEAFDTYDGTTWTIASKDTQTLPTADAPGAYMAQPSRGPDGLANLPSVPRDADLLHRRPATQHPVRRRERRARVLPVGRPARGPLRIDPCADPARPGPGVLRGLRRADRRSVVAQACGPRDPAVDGRATSSSRRPSRHGWATSPVRWRGVRRASTTR